MKRSFTDRKKSMVRMDGSYDDYYSTNQWSVNDLELIDDEEGIESSAPSSSPIRRHGKRCSIDYRAINRMLAANIGKSWAQFYARVRKLIKPTNPLYVKLIEHIKESVLPSIRFDHYWNDYIIDENGLIQKNPKSFENHKAEIAENRKNKAIEIEKYFRQIDGKSYLKLYSTTWVELVTGSGSISNYITKSYAQVSFFSSYVPERIQNNINQEHTLQYMKAVERIQIKGRRVESIRTLSKKEINELKLNNS